MGHYKLAATAALYIYIRTQMLTKGEDEEDIILIANSLHCTLKVHHTPQIKYG